MQKIKDIAKISYVGIGLRERLNHSNIHTYNKLTQCSLEKSLLQISLSKFKQDRKYTVYCSEYVQVLFEIEIGTDVGLKLILKKLLRRMQTFHNICRLIELKKHHINVSYCNKDLYVLNEKFEQYERSINALKNQMILEYGIRKEILHSKS